MLLCRRRYLSPFPTSERRLSCIPLGPRTRSRRRRIESPPQLDRTSRPISVLGQSFLDVVDPRWVRSLSIVIGGRERGNPVDTRLWTYEGSRRSGLRWEFSSQKTPLIHWFSLSSDHYRTLVKNVISLFHQIGFQKDEEVGGSDFFIYNKVIPKFNWTSFLLVFTT